MLTVERMAAASADWAADPTTDRGASRAPAAARAAAGIRVHSVRLRGHGRPPGGAARHDRPDAHDPPRLLRPVVASCPACCSPSRQVADHPGLTVGLDDAPRSVATRSSAAAVDLRRAGLVAGVTTSWSMSTWLGRVATQAMQSAMSSAVSGVDALVDLGGRAPRRRRSARSRTRSRPCPGRSR